MGCGSDIARGGTEAPLYIKIVIEVMKGAHIVLQYDNLCIHILHDRLTFHLSQDLRVSEKYPSIFRARSKLLRKSDSRAERREDLDGRDHVWSFERKAFPITMGRRFYLSCLMCSIIGLFPIAYSRTTHDNPANNSRRTRLSQASREAIEHLSRHEAD